MPGLHQLRCDLGTDMNKDKSVSEMLALASVSHSARFQQLCVIFL